MFENVFPRRADQVQKWEGSKMRHRTEDEAVMSIFELGHADASQSSWEAFRNEPSQLLFSEIIDRSNTEWPDHCVPLARGVAVASPLLLRAAGYCHGSRIPRCWRYLASEQLVGGPSPGLAQSHFVIVSEDWHGALLYTRRYGDLWNVEWATQGMLPQTLVFRSGSTPIVARTYEAAMRLGEFCISTPPRGLCWVSVSGCDRDENLIEFAKRAV